MSKPEMSLGVRMSFGVLLCYLLFVSGMAHHVRKSLTPPMQDKFQKIEIQTAQYFDQHGAMPDDTTFLTPDLQALLTDPHSGVTWSGAAYGFKLDYGGVYPVNITPTHFLTLGLLRSQSGVTGRNITPENIRHNTPLFKAAGYFTKE
ncbi:MAG: hypothetical protein JNM99_22645 [Verrucomicrobiaceae bacterium]|nr:hypothetical protein [Verrucomicrobiaceae bacterium]